MLQTILFGSFTPPPVASTRSNYSAGAPVTKQPITSTLNRKRILSMVKRRKNGVAVPEVADLLCLSKNYCQVVLTSLFDEGIIQKRKDGIKARSVYFYEPKQ
jgi:hypothetical protein